MSGCARIWGWALLAAAAVSPVWADELYRCRAYGGGLFWSAEPCHLRQALVERIAHVPSGLGFERQVQLAEQGARDATRTATRAASVTLAEQRALRRQARANQRQQARCNRLQAEIDRIDSRSRQRVSARRLDHLQLRRRELLEEQGRAAC